MPKHISTFFDRIPLKGVSATGVYARVPQVPGDNTPSRHWRTAPARPDAVHLDHDVLPPEPDYQADDTDAPAKPRSRATGVGGFVCIVLFLALAGLLLAHVVNMPAGGSLVDATPTFPLDQSMDGSGNNLGSPEMGSAPRAMARLMPPNFDRIPGGEGGGGGDGGGEANGEKGGRALLALRAQPAVVDPAPAVVDPAPAVGYTRSRRVFTRPTPASDGAPRRLLQDTPDPPSARHVSNKLCAVADGEDVNDAGGRSAYSWQIGQLVDHDITLTLESAASADTGNVGREFVPIAVPECDEPSKVFDPDCLGNVSLAFTRAGAIVDDDGVRQNMNGITSWVDASFVYGSSDARSAALRADRGRLLVDAEPDAGGREQPPNLKEAPVEMADPFAGDYRESLTSQGVPTLRAVGDVRGNEQPGLLGMHTVFLREHNRWAALLDDGLNDTAIAEAAGADTSDVDAVAAAVDEHIFQRARAHVRTLWQKIVFGEYAPSLLGSAWDAKYVKACKTGSRDGLVPYDAGADATIMNEFASAVFRFGHSQIAETFTLRTNTSIETDVSLGLGFFRGTLVRDRLDDVLRGFAYAPSRAADTKIVGVLRDRLFAPPNPEGGVVSEEEGGDLAAFNIARGRDAGIPTYADVREALGLTRPASYADITDDAGQQAVLAAAYGSNGVDLVDLWIGALSEPIPADRAVGETLSRVVGDTLRALAHGDRYFLADDLDAPVDPEAVATLAGVIRANTGVTGDEIPDNVFLVPS